MTRTFAPDNVRQSELGRAARVFTSDSGSVLKLAQHTETGDWAIWMMYTETHDEERMYRETKELTIEECLVVRHLYLLDTPVQMATKVDDDISPEYARENEGIFEVRCLNALYGC